MRWLIIVLVSLVLILQYKLWFQDGGIKQAAKLQLAINDQTKVNTELALQNTQLRAEVKDLKHGQEAIEERARNELGMVKQNETYVQVVQEKQN
jgi:cell division protein FtsB